MKYRLVLDLICQLYLRLFFGIVVFTTIFLTLQMLRLSEFLIVYHADIVDLGELSAMLSLSFQPLVIPTAMVFSAFSVFGRFVEKKEWLGALTCGIGYRHILPPLFFLFALPCAILTLMVGLEAVPWCSRQTELIRERIYNKNALTMIQPQRFFHLFPGMMIYVEDICNETQEMRHVFIHDFQRTNAPMTIMAKHGKLERDIPKGLIGLNLKDGHLITRAEEDARTRLMRYDKLNINAEIPIKLTTVYALPFSMRLPEIKENMARAEAADNTRRYNEFAFDYHRRFSLPFASIFLVLFAFAFSLSSHKRYIRLSPLMQSFALVALTWMTYIGGHVLVQNGWASPIVALWTPNMILLVYSVFLLTSKRIMA